MVKLNVGKLVEAVVRDNSGRMRRRAVLPESDLTVETTKSNRHSAAILGQNDLDTKIEVRVYLKMKYFNYDTILGRCQLVLLGDYHRDVLRYCYHCCCEGLEAERTRLHSTKIGKGTYGMVSIEAEAYTTALLPHPFLGGSKTVEDEEPMTFAIKLFKSQKEGQNDVILSSAIVREFKLSRELHHDIFNYLHDVHVDPRCKSLALVFEYGDHDLYDIIVQSKPKPLSEYSRKSLKRCTTRESCIET